MLSFKNYNITFGIYSNDNILNIVEFISVELRKYYNISNIVELPYYIKYYILYFNRTEDEISH